MVICIDRGIIYYDNVKNVMREEGGKGTRLGFLCGLILSFVATECNGNLEVNLYSLPSSVSINDWILETESHPTPTPTPSHIGRFS